MSDTHLVSQPIVIIGARGQLGQALMKIAPKAIGFAREQLDLSDTNFEALLSARLRSAGSISGIINAAAYTAVDMAETERDLAVRVNGDAPGKIAAYCALHDVPLVHISTDYVFSGQSKKPYSPDHKTNPINAYGQSKYTGEIAIQKTKAISAILRTSWVYDGLNKNFLTTMLRLAESRTSISVVDDQIGRPTYTMDLAAGALQALHLLNTDISKAGIYHVSNSGPPISWSEFAKAIFETKGLKTSVEPISTQQYPTPAVRPAYSVLDISSFEKTFDFAMPSWRDGLKRALTS